MPDASGKFKGISVPSIPWHEEGQRNSDSHVVSLYGLDGKREHWMPGNRRRGTGPREKRGFPTAAEAHAFAKASSWPQGEVYRCGICFMWHLSKPKRA